MYCEKKFRFNNRLSRPDGRETIRAVTRVYLEYCDNVTLYEWVIRGIQLSRVVKHWWLVEREDFRENRLTRQLLILSTPLTSKIIFAASDDFIRFSHVHRHHRLVAVANNIFSRLRLFF